MVTDVGSPDLLDQIDATGMLALRPRRAADHRLEAEALGKLADVFANSPDQLAQALADAALDLTGAHAAGISLEDTDANPRVFRWIATSGTYSRYLNGTMPRDFSPCGEVVRRNAPVLMRQMHKLYEYVSALHAPPHEVLLVPFLHRGKPVGTVWVVSHDDGCEFDGEDLRLVHRLTRFAGAAVEGVGMLRTLSEANALQEAELAARARKIEQLKGWFDIGPGFVAYVQGRQHEFVFANQPFRSLLGQPGVDATQAGQFDLSLAGRSLGELLDEVMTTGVTYTGQDLPLRLGSRPAAEGPPSHIDLVLQPDRDARGVTQGVFIHGHDCTDRVRSLDSLRELDLRKDHFMAVLAHEIRNPLAAISLNVQLIKRLGDDPVKRRSAVASLERQAGQLGALVRDMTDVVAIRSGKLSLNLQPVTVHQVVANALEACGAQLEGKRHRLEVSLPDSGLLIHGDPVRLTQVLVNLISNAVKCTPEHGSISVSAHERDGALEVSVADSGVGIDAGEIPKVFDMSMQFHMESRPFSSGLAIGMALVRQIVELHDGEVFVSSDGAGKGSTFLVRLPTARGVQPPSGALDASARGPREEG